jgi:hypothetical protein
VQRARAVDYQHPAVAGFRQHRFQQHVVLKAADGADPAGEHGSSAELPELHVAAGGIGSELVDDVGGRAG